MKSPTASMSQSMSSTTRWYSRSSWDRPFGFELGVARYAIEQADGEGRVRYDLSKLRAKRLVERLPKTQRYCPLPGLLRLPGLPETLRAHLTQRGQGVVARLGTDGVRGGGIEVRGGKRVAGGNVRKAHQGV